jgi:hypothetical protein
LNFDERWEPKRDERWKRSVIEKGKSHRKSDSGGEYDLY